MGIAPITTIKELVRQLLDKHGWITYGDILGRYVGPGRDLSPFLRWNTRHYTRTCIHRDEHFELLVICFEAGQATSIHDYDDQNAWVHVIAGELVEERYKRTDEGLHLLRELNLRPGDTLSVENGAIHRSINYGPERTITLNLHAKPLRKWRVYNATDGNASTGRPGPS